MKKGIFILTLLILALFSVSCIYASDVNDTLVASEDTGEIELSHENEMESTDNNLKTNEEQIVTQTDNEEKIGVTDDGTFRALNEKIMRASSGDTVYLENNYSCEDSWNRVGGISIYKSNLVIDGQGHTIDAKGKARIFNVQADNVVLKDIVFLNSNAHGSGLNGYGGAVIWNGTGGSIFNCTFLNNVADGDNGNGGAVCWSDGAGSVSDCLFINNSANWFGGALIYTCDVNVYGCTFINNRVKNDGGAVYCGKDNSSLLKCFFINNSAVNGAAISCSGNNGIVSGCIFINNTGNSVVYFFNWGSLFNNFTVNNNIFLGNGGTQIHFIENDDVSNANCNWFANNATGFDTEPNVGNVKIDKWLFLNATANPDTISVSDTSNIIFKLYQYHSGEISEYDNAPFQNINLTITATNGDVSKNTTKLGEPITFTPTSIGTGSITATIENVDYTTTLTVTTDGTTFWDLNNAINGNANDTITLDKNYTYNSASDSAFTEGILINRQVTINGNGYTIDAQGKARVFNVQARDVTINNLSIKNANYNGNGEAVYFAESGSVINCNFINNTATGIGAIYFQSDCTGRLENCNFTNNTARYGGAIYFISSYTTIEVRNCNFINNSASEGGGALFMSSGTVTNCNFTNNTAISSGAVYFRNNGNVTNCNFINNSASEDAGAIIVSGTVTNCNFVDNKATINGGALFMISGTVTNCNFTNNSASDSGGAIYYGLIDERLTVSNCNFTGNNASWGSAIWVSQSYTTYLLTISNSIFLNNKANAEALEVIKNDNNIIITFTGQNNLLNAIYFEDGVRVSFTNVTYWGANGITNTDDNYPSRSNKEAGQNITIKGFVNGNILNTVKTTDTDGKIVLENVGEYYITVCHDDDSYYTEAETISTNMKYYVNVTETETTNKTVNITAKSNIYNEVMSGKLLFIVPIGEVINATYAGNGTWWAVYTFDDYTDYLVNASYVGLDNVTITNATISISRANSTVNVSDVVMDYGDSKNVTVTAENATGITAMIDGNPVDVINNYTIPISGLIAGNHTLTVTTIVDGDHNNVTKTVNVTVNKVDSTLTVNNMTFDYKATGSVEVSFTGATGVNATVVNQPKATVNVNNNTITVSGLDAGNYTLTVTTITDANHNNITRNATITVNKAKTQLTANAITTTYNINKDLVITLKDANGNVLSGVNVIVDLNGAKTYITDANGQVKVSTKGLAPKAYTAKITFNGDDNYINSNKDVKVTVKKATPKLTAKKKTFKTSVKTKKYTVTLKDNTGKAIKKAKVTLKVKGKTYKATTNSKGKAVFKIKNLKKKGKYTAVIKFKGNKYYNKATKKAKIKVIVTFKTVSKGSKDKATVKEIQKALKNNGYYLTYDGHYLKIDGIYHGCTERSVKEFQHDKGLKVTGKVDEKTAKKLGLI
ncbi:peptidoglycan-binding protein [Methanobrevibacter sp.]|uniref:peptidoglycan-binding protein n=1 Tax=Methanobrevibacter sp. TaxID=66852 RepID=UPI00386C95CE